MPYKMEYNSKTVGKGGSKTPASVMGSQGSPAKITPSPKSTIGSTKMTNFPDGFGTTKAPGTIQNHG